MWRSFPSVLHPLTVILTTGYLLFHFVQVKLMPPERAVRYTGSLIIWLGVTLMSANAVLSDLKIRFPFLVGITGFGLVIYGFFLNEQRDKQLNSPGATHPEPPGRSEPE